MKRDPRMKICVVGLRGVPGVMGGIESHCEQIFPRLVEMAANYDLTIVGRRPYLAGGANAYRGLTVVPLPAARHKYFEAITNTALGILYARFATKADLVHIHGIGPALLSPLARLLGMRVVVTHHGQDFERAKWNRVAKMALRLGEHIALRAADRIIVVSRSVAAELQRKNPGRQSKISYIPNGTTELDLPDQNGAARQVLSELGLEPRNYLLAVGRLVPEKGFHFLIDAYRKAGLACKLVIVGKADHDDAYSQRLMEQADDSIIFAGFQSQAVLRELYTHAALFVLPSTHEGLPIAALEAASLNAPILLSDIRPNLDIGLASDNYFASANVDALVAKLKGDYGLFRVDADDLRRRFNWNVITAETRQIYAELMAA
jgi:glycosyltransferase involved in cell wall biosynthesis